MAFLKALTLFLLLATLVSAGIIGFKSIDDKESFLNLTKNDTAEAGKGIFLYSWGMMESTGAWQKDYLPLKLDGLRLKSVPDGKLIFLLEDMPYPDSTLFIVPILLVLALLAIYVPQTLSGKIKLALFVFLLVVVLYFVQMIIAHHYMYVGGEILGMDKATVDANRQVQVDLMQKAELGKLSVILFLIAIYTYIKIFRSKK